MKKFMKVAALATLPLAMAACDSPAENSAEAQGDAMEATADAEADAMDAQADAMRDADPGMNSEGTEAQAEAMEAEADATREAADDAADKMEADAERTGEVAK
jgi:hypothetical protein